ncbi:MAG TPA: hypothetical protein VGG01_13195 [Xanthobacteraceae bacterium]
MGQHGLDLGKDLEAVFEAAIGARLQHAEEIGRAHARDNVGADAARGFGLLRAFSRKHRDLAGTGDEVRNFGAGHHAVMPALGAGIHVFLAVLQQDVDGRDGPGHDEETMWRDAATAP